MASMVRTVAVHQFLFGQRYELVISQEVVSFDAGNCGKSPTRPALLLVLHTLCRKGGSVNIVVGSRIQDFHVLSLFRVSGKDFEALQLLGGRLVPCCFFVFDFCRQQLVAFCVILETQNLKRYSR